MAALACSNPARIRLLIVDPNVERCDWLVENLAQTGSFLRIIASATISEAKQAAEAGAVDIAVVSRDVRGSNLCAYDLVKYFAGFSKPIRSLVVAQQWPPSEVVDAFRYGAKGLLTGPLSNTEELSKAVTSVYHGQVWANSDQLNHALDYVAAQLPEDRIADSDAKACLSAREQEIAELLARGASNREIAEALHISHRTVKNHLARIFEKMGVTSRIQAALRLMNSQPRDTDGVSSCLSGE